jgi:hypothetical protein
LDDIEIVYRIDMDAENDPFLNGHTLVVEGGFVAT